MKKEQNLKHNAIVFLTAALMLFGASLYAGGDTPSPVYTKVIEGGDYEESLNTLKEVIKGKGINIAHTLPPSEMLERTGPAFGVTEKVLENGEMVEFCSAKISHKLIMANFENISLCPFSISIYVLTADPENVRLSYRKPYVLDEASKEAVAEMTALMEEIITETAEW